MRNKPSYIFHLLFSIIFLVATIIISVKDIFSPGRFSIGNFFLFTCPACLVPLLIPLSLLYWKVDGAPRAKYLPSVLNAVNITIAFVLYGFDTLYPDVAFQLHFQKYTDAVNFVQQSQPEIDKYGYATLPEIYNNLSMNGIIYIDRENNKTSIYFADGADNFDGLSWGYLYRSDGNTPLPENACALWRKLKPPVDNWYYCDANSKWGGFIR